jgi:hypothetical protein
MSQLCSVILSKSLLGSVSAFFIMFECMSHDPLTTAQLASLHTSDMLRGQTVDDVFARISVSTSLAECTKDAIHVQV